MRTPTLLAALLVGACTMGPNFVPPDAKLAQNAFKPASASPETTSVAVPEPIDPAWWTMLGDPILTRLETRLAEANIDVRLAGIRLAESRAQLGVAEAALLPAVGANASYLRQQQSQKGVLVLTTASSAASTTPGTSNNGAGGRGGIPNSRLLQPYDLFQYGFDASWELDFWGRVARGVESAQASALASAEAQRDTLVTASAELARGYIQLRGIQRKTQITRENLEIARQSLALTQARAAGGVTTDLDVANAAALVESIAATLPALEQGQAQTINALSFLLGEPPRALEAELAAPRAVPALPPRVPIGVASELARRRPDIRRAEAQLHAATAEIGVAEADFYPRFVLAGSGAIQGLQLRNLVDWQAQTYALGPSVSLPIFQGGRLTRTLELRKAEQQDAALVYQRIVLTALHEVDNALTAYDAEQRRYARLDQSVQQNRRALRLARDRYEQGVADFLQVLTAQRNLLAADQDLADSTATLSVNLVSLYKALGGGWENALPAGR